MSSPGLDRRLFNLEQMEVFLGSQVKISLRRAFDGQKKFAGQLCGIEKDEVVVRVGEEEYMFPFESIDKAYVVPEFK